MPDWAVDRAGASRDFGFRVRAWGSLGFGVWGFMFEDLGLRGSCLRDLGMLGSLGFRDLGFRV